MRLVQLSEQNMVRIVVTGDSQPQQWVKVMVIRIRMARCTTQVRTGSITMGMATIHILLCKVIIICPTDTTACNMNITPVTLIWWEGQHHTCTILDYQA